MVSDRVGNITTEAKFSANWWRGLILHRALFRGCLLKAAGHSDSGVLARVTSIQRVHTEGGQSPKPEECSKASANSEVRSNIELIIISTLLNRTANK